MKHQAIGEGDAVHNVPAIKLSISDIVADYDMKLAAIPDAIKSYAKAFDAAQTAACIGGTYGGSISSDRGSLSEHQLKSVLLKSAWSHVYDGLQINKIASAKDRKQFELIFANPDPFTLENIGNTFGDYLLTPRWHILKGLAECFCDLDPAYKSHDKVRIGVKGLPKRIIVASVGDYSGWGRDKVQDVLNALNAYNDRSRIEYAEFSELLKSASRRDDPEYYGVTLRRFQNGNCHMIFDRFTLLEINRALAEFYGEVLADSPEVKADQKRRQSTALSTDLAFYPTPIKVFDWLFSDIEFSAGCKVLEPSCGDGRMIFEVLKREPTAKVFGVEVHAGRAEAAQDAGLHVLCCNFLKTAPDPRFDIVIMNPPFAGKHYQKHVEHAKKFLRPGGKLYAILPASAHYDHGFCGDPSVHWNPQWRDLPVGSFKESGTNIPTGIYTWTAPSA